MHLTAAAAALQIDAISNQSALFIPAENACLTVELYSETAATKTIYTGNSTKRSVKCQNSADGECGGFFLFFFSLQLKMSSVLLLHHAASINPESFLPLEATERAASVTKNGHPAGPLPLCWETLWSYYRPFHRLIEAINQSSKFWTCGSKNEWIPAMQWKRGTGCNCWTEICLKMYDMYSHQNLSCAV